jgi:hypothetical protein
MRSFLALLLALTFLALASAALPLERELNGHRVKRRHDDQKEQPDYPPQDLAKSRYRPALLLLQTALLGNSSVVIVNSQRSRVQ